MRNRVRELREQRGWNISEFADKVGVSRPSIYDIETGKFEPHLNTAFKIADAFGLPIEDVFLLRKKSTK